MTALLHNSLFLKACRREAVPRTPIWLMRQAGRYMKEYRALREKHSFMDLCKKPELAADITIHAAHKLHVDAAIIFSDILLILEPLGFKLSYRKQGGPEIANPFRRKKDLPKASPAETTEALSYVYDAIKHTRATA